MLHNVTRWRSRAYLLALSAAIFGAALAIKPAAAAEAACSVKNDGNLCHEYKTCLGFDFRYVCQTTYDYYPK